MARGKDESKNPKRRNFFDRLDDYSDPKTTERLAKELLAAKSDDRESTSEFAHPELMERAELLAEQIKDPEYGTGELQWRKREDR